MYVKPELVEFGTLRDLTLVGLAADGDAGIGGQLDLPDDNSENRS